MTRTRATRWTRCMEDKDKEGKDKVDKDKMEKDKENVLKCVIYI